MFDTDRININELYDQGFTIGNFFEVSSDRTLKALRKLTWITEPDNAALSLASESFLDADSQPRIFEQYISQLNQWTHPLLWRYENPESFSLRMLCCTSGYKEPLHNDVRNRSVLNTVAFFGSELADDSTGGYINVYRVDPREPDNKELMVLIKKITPTNGMILVINNMDPTIKYETIEIKHPDTKQYRIFSQSCPMSR